MTALDDFSPEQRDLLVALPYRVGLWVAHSDMAGGDNSAEAEMRVLTQVITAFAEDFCKSEFAQALMEETVRRQSEWPEWSRNLDEVPGECRRAVDTLFEWMDHKSVLSFKMNLMEIATDVAMAYRELDENTSVFDRLSILLQAAVSRIRARLAGRRVPSMDELLNVSSAEQRALDTLVAALDLTQEHNAAQGRSAVSA